MHFNTILEFIKCVFITNANIFLLVAVFNIFMFIL